MATFSMTSNNQFLRTFRNSPDICVFECQDDLTSYDTVLSPPSRWTFIARVAADSSSAHYTALQLFNTTIRGDQLPRLASDLTFKSNSQTFYLIVNRHGLCFLSVGDPAVKRVRLNDYFGWSKYGVACPVPPAIVWKRFEMFDQRVVVDFEAVRKSLAEVREKEAEMVEDLASKGEALEICKAMLDEYRRRELAGLEKDGGVRETAAEGEMEKWKRAAEEKEEELRKVRRELVAKVKHSDSLKAAVNSLIRSMWDLNKVLREEILCYRLLSGQLGAGDQQLGYHLERRAAGGGVTTLDQYGSDSEQLAELLDQSSHASNQ